MKQAVKIGNLKGILHKPRFKNSLGIVMVHGFGGEGLEKEFEIFADNLSNKGYTVLRFLLSGYENNDLTKSTIIKWTKDLKEAITFLKKQGVNNIGIVAQSLGCTVTIILNDKRVNSMIFLAPTIYPKRTFEKDVGKKGIKQIEKTGTLTIVRHRTGQERKIGLGFYKSLKKINKISSKQIKRIKIPLLIVHGTADEFVNMKESKELFKLANQPKQLKIMEGGRHVMLRDNKIRKEIIRLTLNLFKKYLG